MLYLRTGGNGSGKTLLTLKDVRALQLETGRPVCINIRPADDEKKPNQPYCNIKPEKLDEFGWKKIRFEDWEAQDDNTIFLIDECHYDLPVRSTKVPPPHIQRLTEHRSRGFDFFLLTQHPKNIDSFVRNLVQAPGWHEHIKRIGGALPVAQFHQWDAVKLQCEAFGSAKDANSKTRPYPTEVYTWYDSATIHTGRKRIPWRVWFILVAPVLILWLFWSGFSQVGKGATGKPSSSAAGTAGSGPTGGGPAANQVKTPAEYISSYQPRVRSLMHTAPAYDGLTAPKRVPVPAACVEMPSKGCKCYTQDATPYPVDLAMCKQIVANGIFLAFQAEGDQAGRNQVQQVPAKPQEAVKEAASASPGLVLIGGGIPTAPNPPAPPPEPPTQARVQPGSKWSFTTGGQ